MTDTKTENTYYTITRGNSPLVATAIHDGHNVRPGLLDLFNLSAEDRLREEDPFTAAWVSVADTQIVGHHSRFELDLNRSPEKAIYRKPADAWGLQVWKSELPEEMAQESMQRYTSFYDDVKKTLGELLQLHPCLVVYDLHTYNHRREGADKPAADPQENPEVNIGTGNMNRQRWAPVVDTFMQALRQQDYRGRQLDVRENVKFKGGHFMRWLHDTFGDRVCVMSIEFKKFFMDEWTGQPDEEQVQQIREALLQTTQPVLQALKTVCR